MKFECPDCGQELEIDGNWAGHKVECPACSNSFTIPTQEPALASPPKPVKPRPRVQAPDRTIHNLQVIPKSGGGFVKLILVVVFLALTVFGYVYYQTQQPPQVVWQRLVAAVIKQLSPPPPVAPALPQPPAPAPVAVAPPKVTSPPHTNIVVAPASPLWAPDPLLWIAAQAKKSTVELTLLVDTQFPIVFDGKVAGSGNVPAQSIVDLVAVDPNTHAVTVAFPAYGNSTVTLPIASTDLLERAHKAMAQADAKAAAVKAAAAAPTPPPASFSASTNIVASPTPSSNPSGQEPSAAADLSTIGTPDENKAFIHPGLLHTDADFARMREKVDAHAQPWEDGWEKLIANRHASLDWKPRPVDIVYRGNDHVHTQNYAVLFNDIAAAYACALRWRISGDSAYADKSVEILNAWSGQLHAIKGSTDSCLAAGIYGYEISNAAEIMRTYPEWKPEDFKRFQDMMLQDFYPMNHDFLVRHNGTKIDHYWCNWDACNMDSMLAIGVLCDRRDIYKEAIDYFKYGEGNGCIKKAVVVIHPGNLGQWQESGRDQGHTTLGIGLLGAFCEMAWNQGDDMYGYDDNRFLAGAEYVAKYNLGQDVPYTPYTNSDVTQDVISDSGRGDLRPIWEMVYNHYVNRMGLSAPYTKAFAEKVRPEGGGGDYGPNSGGFDQLGYGTLTFTRSATVPSTAASSSPSPSSVSGGSDSGLAPTQ